MTLGARNVSYVPTTLIESLLATSAAPPDAQLAQRSRATRPPKAPDARVTIIIALVRPSSGKAPHREEVRGGSLIQNLPLSFFHSDLGGMVSMASQCSTTLPLSTRNRS